MGVKRTKLTFEGKFVQVPNEWARDERLSRKARGLLVEVMSHRVGWHVSVSSLQNAGIEGRDAIRSALAELLEFGYLKRQQDHGEAGRFNEVEYELNEPPTADGKPVSGGLAVSGLPDDGSPDVGKSDTKNTSLLEHDQIEDERTKNLVQDEPARSVDSEFEEFWSVFPRRQARLDALKAFKQARRTVSAKDIIDGARNYRLITLGQPMRLIKMAGGWIRDGRYADEDLIPFEGGGDAAPVTPIHKASGPKYCERHPGYPAADWMNPCFACDREGIENPWTKSSGQENGNRF